MHPHGLPTGPAAALGLGCADLVKLDTIRRRRRRGRRSKSRRK